MGILFNTVWDSTRVTQEAENATMDALVKEAEAILAEAESQVPLDTGDLMRSSDITQEGSSVKIGFYTEYAAKQHEEPNYAHSSGRKWKYLEDPFRKRVGAAFFRDLTQTLSVALRGRM